MKLLYKQVRDFFVFAQRCSLCLHLRWDFQRDAPQIFSRKL